MSNKTSRIVFLVVLLLVAAGVAIAQQTVHWRLKLNTGQVGYIVGGPNDTDPVLLSAVQSTQRIGIGTTNPWTKLQITAPAGYIFGIDDTVGVGSAFFTDASGSALGTYTPHAFYLMSGHTNFFPYRRVIITSGEDNYLGTNNDWKMAIGINPITGVNPDARLTVCRRGSLEAGTVCAYPTTISPTVVVLGSHDNTIHGSSLRAKGSLLSEGDINVVTSGKGFVVKESDGANCRRITVNSAGAISVSAGFTCP